MARANDPEIPVRRTRLLDALVGVLAVSLIIFLVITMGVRSDEQAVHSLCQERLMALSLAQQSYLVEKGKYADNLLDLVPYLDKRMPLVCPITGHKFEVFVQQERYIILAPYTPYNVNTGDASW